MEDQLSSSVARLINKQRRHAGWDDWCRKEAQLFNLVAMSHVCLLGKVPLLFQLWNGSAVGGGYQAFGS